MAAVLRQPLSKAANLRVDLTAVLAALATSGIVTSWDQILDRICGQVPVARTDERARERGWHVLWEAELATAASSFSGAAEWLQKLRRDGVLRRLCAGDPKLGSRLLADATKLLCALPLPREELLARVGAQFFGDSHALDRDRPLSTLVLRGLCQRQGRPMVDTLSRKRDLWAEHNVVCDDLSAPVLTHNVRFGGSCALANIARQASGAGFPVHLTTRLLWRTPWAEVACPSRVYVCENPAIVSLAAERYGPASEALVCIDGEPKTAARILLRQLRTAGAQLLYHGDFDWAGIAIARRVMNDFGAQAWRFGALDYAAITQEGRPLSGRPGPSPWDEALSAAMQHRRLAFDEEALAELLLSDLAVPRPDASQ